MEKLHKQRKLFAVLLAALLTLSGLIPRPEASAAAGGKELAGRAGASSLRELLDRRLARRMAEGSAQTPGEAGEAVQEEDPAPAAVPEKVPPAGSPNATDILAAAQTIAHGMGEIGGVTTLNCLEEIGRAHV